MKFLLVLTLMAVSAGVHAQVQKCVQSDGRVTYSDVPCPGSSRNTTTLIQKPAATVSPFAPQPPARVAFTGAAQTDYIKASAIMDNIRVLGRDCEWALKVDKKQMAKGAEFIGKLQPGGEAFKRTEQRRHGSGEVNRRVASDRSSHEGHRSIQGVCVDKLSESLNVA